ncbi:MAG: SUMF1/EgtB/PvdO family nonheme iron enzyme [Saprospiraceae bacterium]|nr:SUMF1/EgtB/PvdO family nonheme iron enzyme [Saprospiraceae bacterium]
MKYKAFISYRHSENGRRHAVALETALKRYAKPTLARPMKIFRDEKHMKPDISLPKLIQDGLENSEYLIFLAEKDAASSVWCQQELEEWCNPEKLNRTDRLIIVLIDDDIVLRGIDGIHWEQTNALPSALQSYLTSIPLYMDLRWAKSATDTDLIHPKYRHEINSLSARLKGVNPEDLNDEEIKTFRRNIRLRNGAIGVLLGMLMIAVGAAWLALEQQKIARQQTFLAKENEQRANEKKVESEQSLSNAKDEQERTRLALIQVKEEKNATEIQRQKAEENYQLAQEKTKEAVRQAETARLAVAEQQKALVEVAREAIHNAQAQIYRLDYVGALETIQPAATLNVAHQEVSDALFEIVFFYAETGRFDRAKGLLDTAARLVRHDLTTIKKLSNVEDFHNALKLLHPARFDSLNARYFPIMVPIPGGTDTLGSNHNDIGSQPRQPQIFTLSPYKMAKTETTWWQYNLFCEAKGKEKPEKPVFWAGDGDNPVTNVSWFDAVEYANWLSEQKGCEKSISKIGDGDDDYKVTLNAKGYRLPTEVEWEYAARASTDYIYAGSNDGNEVAWHVGTSSSRTHPVAKKKANAFGLYDMSGNVSEWCWDWYKDGSYAKLPSFPGMEPEGRGSRGLRGGNFGNWIMASEVANPNDCGPRRKNDGNGFRVAQGK